MSMIHGAPLLMDGNGRLRYNPCAPNGYVSGWIESWFDPGYVGYALDVGASDGVSINTTYRLEKANRWTVVCIEANPAFRPMLKANRGFFKIVAAGAKASPSEFFRVNLDNLEAHSCLMNGHPLPPIQREDVIDVPVVTLEQVLAEHEFPQLDALCIDVEGSERDVLAGIDLPRWKPKVIVVESWERGALDDVLCPLGYSRVYRNTDNDGYVLGMA